MVDQKKRFNSGDLEDLFRGLGLDSNRGSDSFDPFDIFRRGSPFGTSASQPQQSPRQKTTQEIRAEALEKTFRNLVEEERAYLERAVREYGEEVFELGTAPLFQAHARACLYVRDLERAIVSYAKLTTLTEPQCAVLGLIAFHQGNTENAVGYFRRVASPVPEVRLASASLHIRQGRATADALYKILESVLDRSPLAQEIVGTAYFNESEFARAERYFARLADKFPHKERVQLNHLRVLNARGQEVNNLLGQFYYATESKLPPEDVQREILRRQLRFPVFKVPVGRLYQLV